MPNQTTRFRAMTSIITPDAIHRDPGHQAEHFWATTSHAVHHPCPDCTCCREDRIDHTECDTECPCVKKVDSNDH